MKTISLNVYDETVKEIDIEDSLDAFYEELQCSTIDIVTRRIGRKVFDVMCDDEGLFHDPQKISAIDNLGRPMLVGNLMFFHHDDEGNLTGLDARDRRYLRDRICELSTSAFPNGYPMMTQMEYC